MAQVKFSRVISVSSEDPRYPGSNLLKSDVSSCWKCKDAGEKQAIIILQLERLCQIQRIHIGNENSAFVEIFVGKSAVPDSFEVLRVTSLLMSVQDAKNDKQKNSVRFFEYDEFTKSVAEQSWDRVKLICSQPFNKRVQYGLSFVKIHSKSSPAEQNENDTSLLGKFSFKKADTEGEKKNDVSALGKFSFKKNDNDGDEFSVGSFFARRKDISDHAPTAAAAIRAASNDTSNTIKNQISNNSKRLSDVLQDFKDTKRKRNNDAPDPNRTNDGRRSITGRLLYEDNESDEDAEKNELSKKKKNDDTPKTNSRKVEDKKVNNVSATAAVQSKSPKTPKRKTNTSNKFSDDIKEPKRKPFNRLLEGVTFVISGYTNPYRGQLRDKALQMGAKYKRDWDSSCTHLICAFSNTPKLNQVKGHGWIVRKNWIEDCHALRKRLLSSSYKFDPNDTFSKSDDEEIWEAVVQNESLNPTKISNKLTRAKLNSSCSSGEIETVDLSQETNLTPKEDEIYDIDTDVDSDYNNAIIQSLNETVTLRVLPEFFDTKKFYLGTDLPSSTSDMLTRYIIAYKGNVVDDVDDVNYIVSADTRYKENVTGTPVVLPDWIWECNDQKMLISVNSYLV